MKQSLNGCKSPKNIKLFKIIQVKNICKNVFLKQVHAFNFKTLE